MNYPKNRVRPDPVLRFWSKVDKNGPIPAHRPELGQCWVWIACKNPAGYGQYSVNRKRKLAHRVLWEEENGPIPDGIEILHKCDNPACVRHLFSGTHAENMADSASKGRARGLPQIGEKHWKARLSEFQIIEIRKTCRRGHGSKTNSYRLSEKYGVTPGHIREIARGTTWTHLNRS